MSTSIWNRQAPTETSYEAPSSGGGDFEPIPSGTVLTAAITEAKWATAFERPDIRLINLRWDVVAPQAYAKRVIFQKLYVYGNNPSKEGDKQVAEGDKDNRLLDAINANTGGRLYSTGEEPTDMHLQACLSNKMMNIKLHKYDFLNNKQERIKGNTVIAIGQPAKVDEPAPKQQAAQSSGWDDESIPF